MAIELSVKKVDERATLPSVGYNGDAGLDLYAIEETIVPAGKRVMVRTGIAMAIPEGYVGLIWDRSGWAAKFGLHNMAGVIDAGFRGEILVVMFNTGEEDFKIVAGDRIGQMIIQPFLSVSIKESQDLPEAERGEGSFGSTGR